MQELRERLRQLALDVGARVVQHISALSSEQRMSKSAALLKPPPETSAYPDVAGEQVAVELLSKAAEELGVRICVVGDPSRQHHVQLGPSSPATTTTTTIWCYLDAVDGTIKLSGLGNEAGCLRAVNDGCWAVGVAFTDPTDKPLAELLLGDFTVAAVVDGCPAAAALHPKAAVAVKDARSGRFATSCGGGRALHTSSSGELQQAMVFLDSFQAFDARTAAAGDPRLAKRLYCRLIDRTQGGAFDVLRSYGNLSSLLRCMLGWRQEGGLWLEPQCVGFLAINENLANMVPVVPIILGAGGDAIDFAGQQLAARTLGQGRCSVLYAASAGMAAALLEHVRGAAEQG